MSANALLLWMSARREGSWQQFRAAVEELRVDDVLGADNDDASDQFALPLYQALRLNLQRLGHAEFFAGGGDFEWRVTPPTIALTPSRYGWLGILVGARSQKLLQQIHAIKISAKLQTLSLSECPDQFIFTSVDQDELIAIAEKAHLLLQRDAPASLLTCLPPIDDPSVRHPFDLPFGVEWKVDRFSSEDLRWHSVSLNTASLTSGGLFRFSLRHQRYMLFCSRGAAFRIPGQVGKFLVLKRRRRQVLRYDSQNQLLSVTASCRPPFLIERALILCSGSPPSYESGAGGGVLKYAEIPENIAAIAAALLRQELR